MEYYDKLGRKTSEDKATYKVQTSDKVAYKHFKGCLGNAKRNAVALRMTPIEWAVTQNRLCYGADKAGYISNF